MKRKPARRAKKRQKEQRPLALPFVQANPALAEEHANLTTDGYTLAERLFIRINRRTLKANVEVRWTKKLPEVGPKARRTMSHYIAIDLRKVMDRKREAAAR